MSEPDPIRTQVLVVGAGPAGLVAAATLARNGIDVLLVERRAAVSNAPRALVISTRNMELLRSWGVEDAVRDGAADVEPAAWVTRTLASGEGTAMPLGYPTAAQAAAVSPTRPAWAPQDHLEPVLRGLLGSHPAAEVVFGVEVTGLDQDDDGVTAQLRDVASGACRPARATFVIGADGPRSTVREHLGIRLEGPDMLAEFHNVVFHAALADLVGDNRYGITVITAPEAGGVVSPAGPGGRWLFAREWLPGQPRLVDEPPDRLVELIDTAIGVPGRVSRIDRVGGFAFAAQLADRYREGRGFVAGDAAHRMTPRGGTGMNTAIQDAHDLGWKLAWVLRGWARPALLDTYETERRPIGAHNVERSGSPGGARSTADEALPHDLAGRLPHVALGAGRSTLDLVGDGLTVLAEPSWPAGAVDAAAQVDHRAVDGPVARALGVPPGGALLVRPDAKVACAWADPAAAARPGAVPEVYAT